MDDETYDAGNDDSGDDGSKKKNEDGLTWWQHRVAVALFEAEESVLKERLRDDEEFEEAMEKAQKLVREITFPDAKYYEDEDENEEPIGMPPLPCAHVTGFWENGEASVIGLPDNVSFPEIEEKLCELGALIADKGYYIILTGGGNYYMREKLFCYRSFQNEEFDLKGGCHLAALITEVWVARAMQGRREAIREYVRSGKIPPPP